MGIPLVWVLPFGIEKSYRETIAENRTGKQSLGGTMVWLFIAAVTPLVMAYGYSLGLEQFLAKYRWIFVCTILMPVSVVFEVFLVVRNKITFRLNSAPLLHDKRVQGIQEAVKEWHLNAGGTKMCTGRPGWMTMSLRVGKVQRSYGVMGVLGSNLMACVHIHYPLLFPLS